MKRRAILLAVALVALGALFPGTPVSSQPPTPAGIEQLRQDANGEIEVTWQPLTNTPSFIRGEIPLAAMGLPRKVSPATVAFTVADRYATLFGIRQASSELNLVRVDTDALGMRHVTMGQVYQGVEVYGALMKVHVSADGQKVVAISNSFVPGIQLPEVQPRIAADRALAVARKALPAGVLLSGPQLVAYPGTGKVPGAAAQLAWLVERRDDSIPARNVYVVDAVGGGILDVIDHLYVERDRKTYDAENTYRLPGTPKRSEGDGATGDQDVDNAHDFAGTTYDYYANTHGRDSYDGQGATIASTAHYGNSYNNAFWNGEQMVYGDGFPVEDVVAHELTHAVTEHSANLEYRWQSGALNESFSDVFGAMVDRDDWLMGEDLPPPVLGGRDAIRDLSNPPRFGQPDHTDDWVKTCADNEGVHINSGITNKAYYNSATAIGKDKAELVFYRALTVYLQPASSLEDTRAAALQSAQDLYGSDGLEYNGVRDGFNAVGLDGLWNPEPNDCVCAATTALSDSTIFPDQISALEVAATLYRVRDQLLSATAAGQHYRTLYEQHTGRVSSLLLWNSGLRAMGGQILREVTPGLDQLMDGHGDESTVTQAVVDDVLAFLQRLAEEDRARGGSDLAQTIEQEVTHIDWDLLVGMTYADAWAYLNSPRTPVRHTIHLPVIVLK
ncbi:MAG: M4 family metallopeptidase [Ardenticatenaceae bacterium]|nr:M4 family metallopeptidase [Ardenticatenaceae bacterium]